jgi:hypothetical protein
MFCTAVGTSYEQGAYETQYMGTYFYKESCSCILNHDVFYMNQYTECITIIRSF